MEHHRLMIELRQTSRNSIKRLCAVALSKAFDGSLTSDWREAHMKELLQEMEHQAKALAVG